MPTEARTIGQVLELIRAEFPDISVSKVRYLEAEGLISPDRDNPTGYRRFSQHDVERLVYVLRVQRDQYLPLKVIREHLDAIDRGEQPPARVEPEPQKVMPTPPPPPPQPQGLFTRRQLLAQSELPEAALIELERAHLIQVRPNSNLYGREALAIATSAKKLSAYGLDMRQFRIIAQAAATEAALIEQVLLPYRTRAGIPRDVWAEVYKTTMQAHAAILHSTLIR